MNWQETSPTDIIDIYRNVLKITRNTADQTLTRSEQQDLMLRFLDRLPLEGMPDLLERHSYQRLYRMFCYDWLLLDYRNKPGSPTIAELTLHKLEGTLNQLELQALTNLSKSYVSPYRILTLENGHGYLENLIKPKSNYRITCEFEGLMAGDILVTRLLPGPKPWLFIEPWILLMPINQKLLAKSLHQVMKKAGYHKRDLNHFCKKKTLLLLQAINQEVISGGKDMEEMVASIPFHPDWLKATINDPRETIDLLRSSRVFQGLREDREESFLFFCPPNRERLTWSYILVEEERIAVALPPREDSGPVVEALNLAVAPTGEPLEFIKLDSACEQMAGSNERMLEDLSCFLQNHEEMIDDVLLPRRHIEASDDCSRSDFFAKLSFMLGEKLQKKV